VPSLVFLCILSLFMLVISDVHVLITYSMIVESFFITLSVSAVLYFRYSQPDMIRPIKLPLFVPIVFRSPLCSSHYCAVLCGAVRGIYGSDYYCCRNSRLLHGRSVAGQTEMVSGSNWCGNANMPEIFLGFQRGKNRLIICGDLASMTLFTNNKINLSLLLSRIHFFFYCRISGEKSPRSPVPSIKPIYILIYIPLFYLFI